MPAIYHDTGERPRPYSTECVLRFRLQAPAGGRQRFALPRSASLAAVFRAVESAHAQLGIQTYSLSQPTLEQVFVNVVGGRLDSEAASSTD